MHSPHKNKKPPACDACKARRVLCHPKPNFGLPCPRCAEKGILCRTTDIPRGRPRKIAQPSDPAFFNSFVVKAPDSQALTSMSGTMTPAYSFTSHAALRPARPLERSSEVVKPLYECFSTTPDHMCPLFRICGVRSALKSVGWQIDLLTPEMRVLVYCACALASSISFHTAIIGPGPLVRRSLSLLSRC
ncbi:hypothetical protein B0H17DRAFT_450501 [Mycena rosella]|uniref:Zn(2)-C6 fungal-type domain-containing protein n=1 Tax=Mycena rosella TaxID=1033263 RepID=A0AAD7GYP6_MYCRO|nr:hypothetical protein B0H17DRAFT_450501 [Mycena rosella]